MSGGATEWEDLLIQHGILKAPRKPDAEKEEIVYKIDNKSEDSDDLDLDDAEFLSNYRYRF